MSTRYIVMMRSAPNLLLRLQPNDEPATTCRLPELLRDNDEEYDGQHADWIAALTTAGEVHVPGGGGHYVDITVIDPADESPAEQSARERAWKPLPICPICAGRGRVYAGPAMDDGWHLSSQEIRARKTQVLAGPFAHCPNGCETPQTLVIRTVALTSEILARRSLQVVA